MAAALSTRSLLLFICLIYAVSLVQAHGLHWRVRQELLAADPSSSPALTFVQRLDHFDPQNQATFNQSYLVNNTNSSSPTWGPIFIQISGEAPMNPFYVSGGEIYDLAAANGAIHFMLEHRFYGSSIPNNDLSVENLKYLSADQALADLAAFISAQLANPLSPPNNRVVVFGCSYAGAMSAWLRLKYPHVVFASLASSAPVQAKASFYEYDQSISEVLGDSCSNAIRNATAIIEAQLDENATAVFDAFGCVNSVDPVGFLYVLADTVAYTAQYATGNNVTDMCTAFENSTDPVQTYIDYVNSIYNLTDSTCDDFDLTLFTNTVPDDAKYRQWVYQSCTEFGWFQTAPANNSLRSTRITLQWHLTNVCEKLFGDGVLVNGSIEPNINATNINFGSVGIKTSNTLFTNGGNDPWRTMSVTSDLSDSVTAIVIDGASHCANWRSNRTTDPLPLVAARAAIARQVYSWLHPSVTQHTKQNKILSYIAVIAGTAVLAAALGMIIGYLLAGKKRSGYERIGNN